MISVHDTIRRVIVGGLIFSVLSVFGKVIGGRIERVSPTGILRSWLAEIGSDFRWLGLGLGATIGLGYAIAPWWDWAFPVAKFFVWFQVILFVALSLVAFVKEEFRKYCPLEQARKAREKLTDALENGHQVKWRSRKQLKIEHFNPDGSHEVVSTSHGGS
jgi:hypothetical protein